MSDTRMLPTVHPFAMISIDPITSWPIILPDNSIKKLPILIVLCRQTGFVWHKILFNWTTKSFTLAIMILQYRYGKMQSIVSDQDSNLNPLSLNPGISVDGKEKRLMSIIIIIIIYWKSPISFTTFLQGISCTWNLGLRTRDIHLVHKLWDIFHYPCLQISFKRSNLPCTSQCWWQSIPKTRSTI